MRGEATRVGSVTLEISECLECMGTVDPKVRQVTQSLRAAWLMLASFKADGFVALLSLYRKVSAGLFASLFFPRDVI